MTKRKTQVERNRKLRKENEKRGLVEVCTWVPKGKRVDLLALSALWRRQHAKGGGNE